MSLDDLDPKIAPDSNRSIALAAGAVALALFGALFLVLTGEAEAWIGGISVFMVLFGVFSPHRGGVAAGVLLLACGSLVATSGTALPYLLTVNAVFALVGTAILVVADLSFVTRRATVVSPVTLHGWVSVHAVTSAFGVVAAVGVLSLTLAVTWPGWMIVVPTAVLTVAAFRLVRLVKRYQAGVNTVPQPPAPVGLPRAGPPPTAIGSASARTLRATMPQPPAPRSRQPPPPSTGQLSTAARRRPPPPPPPRSR